MNMAYNPRQHAQEVAQGNELARQVLRELALQRGLLERVLQAVTATTRENDNQALDALIDAAAAAMGSQTWAVSDLLVRATKADPAGLRLLAVIASTEVRESNPRSLGRYLAERVKPGSTWITATGYQLMRSMDGNLVVWTVARVV